MFSWQYWTKYLLKLIIFFSQCKLGISHLIYWLPVVYLALISVIVHWLFRFREQVTFHPKRQKQSTAFLRKVRHRSTCLTQHATECTARRSTPDRHPSSGEPRPFLRFAPRTVHSRSCDPLVLYSNESG